MKVSKLILSGLSAVIITGCTSMKSPDVDTDNKISYYESALWYVKGSPEVREMAMRWLDLSPGEEASVHVIDSTTFIPYANPFKKWSLDKPRNSKKYEYSTKISAERIDSLRSMVYENEKININVDNKSRISLFMSSIYDNTLAVEALIDMRRTRNYDIIKNTSTEGRTYILYFDDRGDIVRVYKYGSIYN